jgi:hypothetical protein
MEWGNVFYSVGVGTFLQRAAKEYKETRGNANKALFRLAWAKAQYETIQKTKTELLEKSHEDISKGTYECFANVVKFEGGKEPGKGRVGGDGPRDDGSMSEGSLVG